MVGIRGRSGGSRPGSGRPGKEKPVERKQFERPICRSIGHKGKNQFGFKTLENTPGVTVLDSHIFIPSKRRRY